MLKGIRFAIIVLSDRAALGVREDAAGPLLRTLIEKNGGECVRLDVLPDDAERLRKKILDLAVSGDYDVILTSGGTGIGPRDCSVDVARSLLEKELPGFGEEMRRRSLEKTPYAILSRATAGVVHDVFLLNLPGSPQGAVDCLTWVLKPLEHAVRLLKKQVVDCQSQLK
ncbi:MAG: MogA/MoaB family molybdenum cofactor biosynthesis protein [Candidatus Omnitrophota bacterium]